VSGPSHRTADAARPRVGLVAPLSPQVGGIATFADWLLTREDELGCRFDPFDLERDPADEAGGRLRAGSLARQARLLRRFRRWADDAPEVVHYCVSWSLTGLARDITFLRVLRKAGRRPIAHVHVSTAPTGARRALARRLGRIVPDRVTISPWSEEALARAGVEARCIFNPVPVEPDGAATPGGEGPLRLLFVGAYGARKGCPELVDALARAQRAGIRAELTFLGKERRRGEETRLRRLAERHGVADAIRWAGVVPREAVGAFYRDADAVCLPSHGEGVPMTLLEGMAFGLPVLATRGGGIPDLVDEASGILVEPGDAGALAEAIATLAADPARRARMGEAARRRALAVGDPHAIATAWRETYAAARAA
jgi:glycosyltransferase involved in cell wall biosynthesis